MYFPAFWDVRAIVRASLPAAVAASRKRPVAILPAEARRRRLQGRRQTPDAAPTAAKNGKRIAIVGGGPASLTPVARDLAPLGYRCTPVSISDPKAGGMMRSQIPKFRLPDLR